jgi:dihydrofolate reductase
MSLDGFITDPKQGTEDPGRLHDWMFDRRTDADAELRDEAYRVGAVVIGKRMFDLGYEPWGDPPPFGRPVFIVTHEQREPLEMQGGTTYTFVAEGVEAAVERAREAAGDRDVGIWGGADVASQALRAGLVDELNLHLAAVLLGDGVRLFDGLGPEPIELERTRLVETPAATHLRFTVMQ